MNTQVLQGLLVPFLGTTLGAALVFFLKRDLPEKVQKGLSGFAAGVMVAASIWSLLIPALEGAADLGAWSFLPATIGFWLGILFLLLLDRFVPHVHLDGEQEGLRASLTRSMMVALAVALHNLPEGMAVGGGCSGGVAAGRRGLRGQYAAGAGRQRIFRQRVRPCRRHRPAKRARRRNCRHAPASGGHEPRKGVHAGDAVRRG